MYAYIHIYIYIIMYHDVLLCNIIITIIITIYICIYLCIVCITYIYIHNTYIHTHIHNVLYYACRATPRARRAAADFSSGVSDRDTEPNRYRNLSTLGQNRYRTDTETDTELTPKLIPKLRQAICQTCPRVEAYRNRGAERLRVPPVAGGPRLVPCQAE